MKKLIPLFLFLIGLQFQVFADSPITSTDFWKAYDSEKIVKYASQRKGLNKKIAKYLMKKNKPIAVKAAVINALSWDIEGKSLDAEFKVYLANKHKTSTDQLSLDELRGDELMCLGYMMVMSDYFNPGPSIPVLQAAVDKLPNSLTAHMILALAEAQAAFDNDWCRVYQVVAEVQANKNLDQDLNLEAVDIIMEYINLYKNDCK